MEKGALLIMYTILGVVSTILGALRPGGYLEYMVWLIFFICICAVLVIIFSSIIEEKFIHKYRLIQQPFKEKFHKDTTYDQWTKTVVGSHEAKKKVNRYEPQQTYLGEVSQSKLHDGHVTVVGLGGAGYVAAELLTRAGVGTVSLIDNSEIFGADLRYNYSYSVIGRPRSLIAQDRLHQINNEVTVFAHHVKLNQNNVNLINSDVVIDCTRHTKLDKYCLLKKIPLIVGVTRNDHGYVQLIQHSYACHECSGLPDSRESDNPTRHMAASIMVTQAIKLLTQKKISHNIIEFDNNGTLKQRKLAGKCRFCSSIKSS